MNPIRTNKPVFFADDGEPLASGYIYVGLPGQDPRNFPKTVTFEDSSGAQFTAAQPMRTNAQGQISYNGKAIIALVEGDYSLLIEDRTGTQTKDGWTPTVSNTEASGGGGGTTEVGVKSGVLLGDIKLLDVQSGDIVRNAGKLTATDALGADWLVVANTGVVGDDVDLIDFSNARQGRRLENQVYRKDMLTAGQFIFDAPIVAVNGSAASYLAGWTAVALPFVPAGAYSAIVRIRFSGANNSTTSLSAVAYARRSGTAAAANEATRAGESLDGDTVSGSRSVAFVSEITVPLAVSGASTFDLRVIAGALDFSVITVTVVGYTINARSVV